MSLHGWVIYSDKYIESDNMLNTFWLLFLKTRDIRENIERKKHFQTSFTSKLRSA